MNGDKELIASGMACVNLTPNADLIESAKIVTAANLVEVLAGGTVSFTV